LLARGRYTAPLEAEGFDVFGALPAPRDKKPAARKESREELRKARARLRELEKTVRAAEREAEQRKSDWKESARAAESARVGPAVRLIRHLLPVEDRLATPCGCAAPNKATRTVSNVQRRQLTAPIAQRERVRTDLRRRAFERQQLDITSRVERPECSPRSRRKALHRDTGVS